MRTLHDRNDGRRWNAVPCRSKPGERGATVILFSFMLVTIMAPLIGFAVDGSVCYWMKTKLSSSVDSAALAAARSLSLASSSSLLQSQGASTASEYFTANFQPGSMGTSLPSVTQASPCTTNSNPCTTVTLTSAQVITVTVQATVSVPLYFLRLIGFSSANLSDTGQSTRRSANVMLVLDRSYSMQEAGVCSTLVASAQNFVNDFVDGRDTLGLVTFQATANNDYALNTYFKSSSPSLNTTLSGLVCTGYTTTAEALNLAYTKLQALNQPSALNVILLFTDGQPDSIVATFPVKTSADNSDRYQWSNTSTLANPSPASGCTSTTTVGPGVLIDADGAPDATGYTAGIYPDTPTAITYSSPYIAPASTISAPGCAFINTSSYPTYTGTVREDVAYLPSTDKFGNLLTGYKSLDYYTAGPYINQPRVDTPRSVMYAATNAANNQANTIRNSGIIIYTIGLGGTAEQQIDSDFLMRVANDPTLPSSEYNSSQPAGLFVYATAGSLGQAFEQIASEILHLSQ
ncbi:MAG TPA: vWA domain-containing protein [Bryobacteraceae bacterium]|jgi:Mg-chelatase subunit ChlD|nr:vWA domain-containing protein [Bryobacteraceae bacterium]